MWKTLILKYVLKVKISKQRSPNGTKFIYPEGYDPEKIKVVAYQDEGLDEELCIGIVDDDFQLNDKIIEITEEEINTLGKEYKPQEKKITDQSAVLLALSTPEAERTEEQIKVLDENDPTPGINITREFNITDYV